MSFLDEIFGNKDKGKSRSNRNNMMAKNEKKSLGKKVGSRPRSAIEKRRALERELLRDT